MINVPINISLSLCWFYRRT